MPLRVLVCYLTPNSLPFASLCYGAAAQYRQLPLLCTQYKEMLDPARGAHKFGKDHSRRMGLRLLGHCTRLFVAPAWVLLIRFALFGTASSR